MIHTDEFEDLFVIFAGRALTGLCGAVLSPELDGEEVVKHATNIGWTMAEAVQKKLEENRTT